MHKKVPSFLVVLSVLALLSATATILMVACSERTTRPGENPETTTALSLFAPPSVQVDQAAEINAEITDQDANPVSAEEVSFSVTPYTRGFFTPSADSTDETGMASTVFTATELGLAKIIAEAEGAQDTAEIEVVAYTTEKPDGPSK